MIHIIQRFEGGPKDGGCIAVDEWDRSLPTHYIDGVEQPRVSLVETDSIDDLLGWAEVSPDARVCRNVWIASQRRYVYGGYQMFYPETRNGSS